MVVNVRIPTPLRGLSGGADVLAVRGNTVSEALEALEQDYPGFRERIYDDRGEVRRFVNIYVAGDDIRYLDGVSTPIKDGQEISIVPAVAGGARQAPASPRARRPAKSPFSNSVTETRLATHGRRRRGGPAAR